MPLDLREWPEPPVEDRSGPPLSQGTLYIMFAMVAAEELGEELVATLGRLDPMAWYSGQLFETVLNEFEDRDATLPLALGRSVYVLFRARLAELGITTPAAVIAALPILWQQVTRGDSGVLRSTLTGPNQARVELEQPYNCQFEEGAIRGFVETLGAVDIVSDHRECMRHGAPCCVLDLRWRE